MLLSMSALTSFIRPLIAYLRKFYYYDPEEEISPTLKDLKDQKEAKESGSEQSSQSGVESQT